MSPSSAGIIAAGGGSLIGYDNAVLVDTPHIFYKLNEAAGATTAVDSSGGGRNGTMNQSYLDTGAAGILPSVPGDTCVDILGTEDKVPISYTSPGNPSSFTVEAIVNVDNLTLSRTIAEHGDGAVQRWRLSISPAGALEGWATLGGTLRTVSGGSFVVGTSYHVAYTWDGTTQRIYRNGVQVNSSAPGGSLAGSAWPLRIGNFGAQSSNESFNGRISRFALYNSAVSAARLATHFSETGL